MPCVPVPRLHIGLPSQSHCTHENPQVITQMNVTTKLFVLLPLFSCFASQLRRSMGVPGLEGGLRKIPTFPRMSLAVMLEIREYNERE